MLILDKSNKISIGQVTTSDGVSRFKCITWYKNVPPVKIVFVRKKAPFFN